MMNLSLRASLVIVSLACGTVAIACSSSDDGGQAGTPAAGSEAGSPSSGGGSGSSAICADKSTCANDPAPTQSSIDKCTAAITDASCGAKYEAYAKCVAANRKCTSAGKTDPLPTAAACKTEASDYASCKGPVDAGKG